MAGRCSPARWCASLRWRASFSSAAARRCPIVRIWCVVRSSRRLRGAARCAGPGSVYSLMTASSHTIFLGKRHNFATSRKRRHSPTGRGIGQALGSRSRCRAVSFRGFPADPGDSVVDVPLDVLGERAPLSGSMLGLGQFFLPPGAVAVSNECFALDPFVLVGADGSGVQKCLGL